MPALRPHNFESQSERLAREQASRSHPYSGQGVTAVLGPTNTGKTHLAIERMIAHPSGLIGLPLRLLAREVYTRLVERVGEGAVSLITGEEKIKPPNARYSVCTVEALPRTTRASFVAIDEVQLAGDLARGHVFTDRILNLRGLNETLLLGAATMRGILTKLLPGLNILTRPRMSHLAYAGSKKITRLPRKSAIVAFSADEVYAIAELIRRQRGGAAVVLGALSPRTRNAQVELFQHGDVEFLVATDAIGMGLNLDLDHVAFAQDHKFDGFQTRPLTPAEMAQIAGRAGRHIRDGTFGVTGHVPPLDDELVERIESHDFAPVKTLQWRSPSHDFSSLEALKRSVETPPDADGLSRALPAHDVRALEIVSRDEGLMTFANRPERVRMLWEACALPDYRRIAPAQHAELVASIFRDLATLGHVDEEFMASQVSRADSTEGEIDTLSARIAQIRTWTFVSHRPNWLHDPEHWQGVTRDVEDRLSDALHERLTKRFVDRRTSVLMRRLREKAVMEAEIGPDGDVHVEGHVVGHLEGFRFRPDTSAEGQDAKAVAAASRQALALEYEARSARLAASPNSDFVLASDGKVRWQGQVVAQLASTDDALRPRVVLLADDALTGAAREKVSNRIERHVRHQIETVLKPLIDLKDAPTGEDGIEGAARGLAFRLVEEFGVLPRREVAEEVRGLVQDARAALRRRGVRFGFYHIFVPALLKPAPAELLTLLWTLKNDAFDKPGYGEIVPMLASGRTSIVVDQSFAKEFYRLAGYRVMGGRAVRIDILERLADLIRPATQWEPSKGKRPEAGYDGKRFITTPGMMSILGAKDEDLTVILKALGYRAEPVKASEVAAKLEELDGGHPPATDGGVTVERKKSRKEALKTAPPGPGATNEAPEAATALEPADESGSETEEQKGASESRGVLDAATEVVADTVATLASVPGDVASGILDAVLPESEPERGDAAEPESNADATADGEKAAEAAKAADKTEEAGQPGKTVDQQAAEAVEGAKDTSEGSPEHKADAAPQESSESGDELTVLLWRQGPPPGARRHRGRGQGATRDEKNERGEQRKDRRGSAKGRGKDQSRDREGGKGEGNRSKRRPDRGPNRNDRGPNRNDRPRRERQPDPDSPFAKLAVLKAELGKK